jgi:hypothetical protein
LGLVQEFIVEIAQVRRTGSSIQMTSGLLTHCSAMLLKQAWAFPVLDQPIANSLGVSLGHEQRSVLSKQKRNVSMNGGDARHRRRHHLLEHKRSPFRITICCRHTGCDKDMRSHRQLDEVLELQVGMVCDCIRKTEINDKLLHVSFDFGVTSLFSRNVPANNSCIGSPLANCRGRAGSTSAVTPSG